MVVQVGDVFHERYWLDRQIASDGPVPRFLATDLRLERRVVLECTALLEAPGLLAQLEAALQDVAALQHGNLLGILDYGTVDRTAYLVLPYVVGRSLGQQIRLDGPLSLDQAGAYLQQAAAALDYAHRQGVVHGGLHPDSLLVREADGCLLLADWGLNRAYRLTHPQEHPDEAALVPYSAPEQLLDRPVGASDLYALGCVLWALLTGAPPYRGSVEQVVYDHLRSPLPLLAAHWPDQLPAGLDRVLARALAKQPAARFATAGEFAEAFQASVGHARLLDTLAQAFLTPLEREQAAAQPVTASDATPPAADRPGHGETPPVLAESDAPPPRNDPPQAPTLWRAHLMGAVAAAQARVGAQRARAALVTRRVARLLLVAGLVLVALATGLVVAAWRDDAPGDRPLPPTRVSAPAAVASTGWATVTPRPTTPVVGTGVAWSPDGTTVATSAVDATVRPLSPGPVATGAPRATPSLSSASTATTAGQRVASPTLPASPTVPAAAPSPTTTPAPTPSPAASPPGPTTPPPATAVWSMWTSQGGMLTDAPAAAEFNGRVYVFATGSDNALYVKSSPDSAVWTGWQRLGGDLSAAPAAASVNGRLYAFVRGRDNTLYAISTTDGQSYSPWTTQGGILTAPPAATGVNGVLYVFAKGGDNALYLKRSTDGVTFSAWQNLGGILTAAPAAAGFQGQVYVFAKGGDNALYEKHAADGVTFTNWSNYGGILTAAPAAASYTPGGGSEVLSTFAKGADNALYERHTSDGVTWTGWVGLGGQLLGPPAAAGVNGQLYAFVWGRDNTLWERHTQP